MRVGLFLSGRRSRAVCAWALCAAVVCAGSGSAVAGNLESYFLGNEAAMVGGAVLPVTGDAGATWYNPAGLGAIERDGVEVNASAFVLQILRVPDLITVKADAGTHTADGDQTQLRSVPTAIVMTRRLGDHVTAGFGVFVPMSEEDEAEADFAGDGSQGTRPGRLIMHVRRDLEMYYAGGSIGWGVTPRLRLGWSLFLAYASSMEDISLTAGIGTRPGEPYDHVTDTRQLRVDDNRIGVQAAFGLQWEPIDHLHLGLALRSPLMQIYQHSDTFSEHSTGGPGAVLPSLLLEQQETSRWGFEQVIPMQAELGVAYSFGWGWVSAQMSVRPPLDAPSLGVEADFLWNARLGAKFRLSDSITVGTGLFTDRDTCASEDAAGDFDVDFYGVALGAEFRTLHALADNPAPDALVFSTTVGLRYGLGVGQVGGVLFEIDPEVGFTGEEHLRRDALVHELTLHLGSSVLF